MSADPRVVRIRIEDGVYVAVPPLSRNRHTSSNRKTSGGSGTYNNKVRIVIHEDGRYEAVRPVVLSLKRSRVEDSTVVRLGKVKTLRVTATTSPGAAATPAEKETKKAVEKDVVEESKWPVKAQVFPFKNPNFKGTRNTSGRFMKLKRMLAAEKTSMGTFRRVGYADVEAGWSRVPPLKYSDISGFESKYTEPRTTLRFASKQEYMQVRYMGENDVRAYLSVRKADTSIQ